MVLPYIGITKAEHNMSSENNNIAPIPKTSYFGGELPSTGGNVVIIDMTSDMLWDNDAQILWDVIPNMSAG